MVAPEPHDDVALGINHGRGRCWVSYCGGARIRIDWDEYKLITALRRHSEGSLSAAELVREIGGSPTPARIKDIPEQVGRARSAMTRAGAPKGLITGDLESGYRLTVLAAF